MCLTEDFNTESRRPIKWGGGVPRKSSESCFGKFGNLPESLCIDNKRVKRN